MDILGMLQFLSIQLAIYKKVCPEDDRLDGEILYDLVTEPIKLGALQQDNYWFDLFSALDTIDPEAVKKLIAGFLRMRQAEWN